MTCTFSGFAHSHEGDMIIPDARRQTPDARRQTPDARRQTPDARERRIGDGDGPESPIRVLVNIGSWESETSRGVLVPPGPDDLTACLHTGVNVAPMGDVSLDLDFDALHAWVLEVVEERHQAHRAIGSSQNANT